MLPEGIGLGTLVPGVGVAVLTLGRKVPYLDGASLWPIAERGERPVEGSLEPGEDRSVDVSVASTLSVETLSYTTRGEKSTKNVMIRSRTRHAGAMRWNKLCSAKTYDRHENFSAMKIKKMNYVCAPKSKLMITRTTCAISIRTAKPMTNLIRLYNNTSTSL